MKGAPAIAPMPTARPAFPPVNRIAMMGMMVSGMRGAHGGQNAAHKALVQMKRLAKQFDCIDEFDAGEQNDKQACDKECRVKELIGLSGNGMNSKAPASD